jgi:hypothetical protein
MAFTLAFSVAEQGDAKLITVTDTTGTDTGGWGDGGNPELTDIADGSLLLTFTITTSDGVAVTYDAIDLHPLLAAHATTADLVFDIDCSMLIDPDDSPLGTNDTQFPDGLYAITYDWTGTGPTHTHATVLIDGVVKADIYELLRTIPTRYECEDNHERETLDIIFIKGYYDALIATALVGREDEIVNQLSVLEKLVNNGSNYSW